MKIVIIGAGLGGLSAAAYLAKAGHEVTILEKNSWAGGRIQSWEKDGFKFDLGPSWYWMKEVMENFFKDFGKRACDFYELKRLDPSYRIVFEDETVELPASVEGMVKLFEKLEPGAGKKLEKLLEQTSKVYGIAMKIFVPNTYRDWGDLMDIEQIIGGIKILSVYNGFASVESYYRKYFRNEKLIKILSFPIFFLGESTRRIPSVYALMNKVGMVDGTWYPMGGFGRVAEAFERIAQEVGVKFRFNQEVEKIEVREGIARKVVTKDGKEYEADVIISNGDYYQTDQKLLDEKWRSYSSHYWEKRRLAPSAFLVHLGLKKKLNSFVHHTLFFHNPWGDHNEALFDKKGWPVKPLYYVSCPSKSDKGVAPKGGEVMTILVPLAAGLEDSDKRREGYAKRIIDDLENKTGEKIREAIMVKKIYGIKDFSNDYNAFKGNAYGLGQTALQTAVFRPSFKSKKVDNLFYCGQFTTPGIGVPLVMISGKITAREIIKKYGR